MNEFRVSAILIFYKIAQILMCDLILFFGIASTQDEFVLFDKIAQNRKSIKLFAANCTNCRKIYKHEWVRLLITLNK